MPKTISTERKVRKTLLRHGVGASGKLVQELAADKDMQYEDQPKKTLPKKPNGLTNNQKDAIFAGGLLAFVALVFFLLGAWLF